MKQSILNFKDTKAPILGTLGLMLMAVTNLSAQIVQIPDSSFKAYLVNNEEINLNGDNEIQMSEAESFTGHLDCSDLGIQDLTGLEAFTALNWLNCADNPMDSLDFSANPALDTLICYSYSEYDDGFIPYLNYLNVSNNQNLRYLKCGNFWSPGALEILDLSNCQELRYLDCAWNNISELIINAPLLERLFCNDNNLNDLNLGNSIYLDSLNCSGNNLTEIDVTNMPLLKYLNCHENDMFSLDISENPLLEFLDCTDNSLFELIPLTDSEDIPIYENLLKVHCNSNSLSSLDISTCPNLITLTCASNNLTSLDLRNGNNENMHFSYDYDNPGFGGGDYGCSGVWAFGNPYLNCVDVDDPDYASANWDICIIDVWSSNPTPFDEDVMFSASCATVSVNKLDINNPVPTLFPNPATDILNIQSSRELDSIVIYSQSGQELLQQTINNESGFINVSKLSPGIYIAKMQHGGNSEYVRFVVAN